MSLKLQIPASILCGAISISCGGADNTKEPTPLKPLNQPNVIVVLVDDLGWNDLGCMGSTFYSTPVIDKLAESGALFTNGYAGANVSSPSRGSILTGKSPARHGITSWIGDLEGEEWREIGRHVDKLMPATYRRELDTMEYTIANALSDDGYATFFVGKWHLGDEVKPTDFGFDVNIGGSGLGSPKGGYFSPFDNPALPDGRKGENLTERLTGEALTRVAKHITDYGDKPFFLMLSHYAVHAPLQTDENKWFVYQDKAYRQGLITDEEGFDDFGGNRLPSRIKQDNPIYAGMITDVDNSVGQVMSFLSDMRIMENTIVIFTSDNGGVVSGDNYSTSLRPLRGGKGTQWEGGTRVPFIVYYPGMEHMVIDEPVIGMDIYPTLLDLVGLEQNPEQHVDGKSLRPLLENGDFEDRSLFWHYPHYGNQGGEPSSIIRDGDWKLIYFHEDNRIELYNLADDISESNDLAPVESERVNNMMVELHGYLRETDAKMPTPDPTYSEAEGEKWRENRYNRAKASQEILRAAQLDPYWKPNKNWWGSVNK